MPVPTSEEMNGQKLSESKSSIKRRKDGKESDAFKNKKKLKLKDLDCKEDDVDSRTEVSHETPKKKKKKSTASSETEEINRADKRAKKNGSSPNVEEQLESLDASTEAVKKKKHRKISTPDAEEVEVDFSDTPTKKKKSKGVVSEEPAEDQGTEVPCETGRRKKKNSLVPSPDCNDVPRETLKKTWKKHAKLEMNNDQPSSSELQINQVVMDATEKEDPSENKNDNILRRKVTESQIFEFKIKEFRKNLFFSEVGTELIVFSSLIKNKKRDVVKEYFEDGGSTSEILAAMAKCYRASSTNALAALQILEQLFLRTMRDFPLQKADSEESAIRLMSSAAGFINTLLGPSQSEQRTKIALNLLTAMVSLSRRVAYEILRSIELNKETVARLTNKPSKGSFEKSFTSSKTSIRKCFLHFLMAFIVDGDATTIQFFISKNFGLQTALLGLVHDSAHIIHLVLTALHIYILKNPGVSKASKQRVFNTRVLENLVLLYDWKGPDQMVRKRHKLYSKKITVMADAEDIKLVQDTIHSFFLSLLTSHKHGIVFTSKGSGTSTSQHNQHVFTVLRCIKQPWETPLQEELVTQVLCACPNLLKPTLAIYSEALIPRPTSKWLKSMDFIIQVLKAVSAANTSKEMNLGTNLKARNITNMIEGITLPVTLLIVILKPGMSHAHAAVREKTASLLCQIFECLESNVQFVNDLLQPAEIISVKQLISNKLTTIVPEFRLVLNAWDLAFKIEESESSNVTTDIKADEGATSKSADETSSSEDSTDEATASNNQQKEKLKIVDSKKIIPFELPGPNDALPLSNPLLVDEPSNGIQLTTYLSVIWGYQKWLPHWTESTNFFKKVNKILLSLKTSTDKTLAKLRLRLVCLFASLESATLNVTDASLPYVLNILLNNCNTDKSAEKALHILLSRLDILKEYPLEINIWLWSLAKEKKSFAIELLTRGLVRLAKDPLHYADKYYEVYVHAQDRGHLTSAKQQLVEMIEELELEMSENADESRTEDPKWRPKCGLLFSPLILAVLDEIEESRTKKVKLPNNAFIQSVLIRLLYHQSHPSALTKFILPKINILMPETAKYLKRLVAGEQPTIPDQFHGIISSHEISVIKYVCGEINNVEWKTTKEFDKDLLLQYFVSAVFFILQISHHGTLTEPVAHRTQEVLQLVLSKASPEVAQHCLCSVLVHPLLLGQFSLTTKDSSTQIMTSLLMSLAFDASKLNDRRVFTALRHKIVHQLISCVSKKNSTLKFLSWCDPDQMFNLLNTISLDQYEISSILDSTFKQPSSKWLEADDKNLGMCGLLATCMLNRCVILRQNSETTEFGVINPLSSHQVSEISRVLFELAETVDADLSPLENAFRAYLNLYSHNLKDVHEDLLGKLILRSNESSLELAAFLLSLNPNFIAQLQVWLPTAEPRCSLPLIWAVQKSFPDTIHTINLKYTWDKIEEDVLSRIKKYHKISRILRDNVDCVIFLLKLFLDSNKAQKIVRKCAEFAHDKIHAQLMLAVWSLIDNCNSELALWLVRNVGHVSEQPDQQDLASWMCLQLRSCLNSETSLHISDNMDDIIQFCKFTLKLGVGSNPQLLAALADLLLAIPACAIHDQCFEMLVSHSKFLQTMLGKEDTLKYGIIKVMYCATKIQPTIMNVKHVPLLLGAYRASLNVCDQMLLKLLRHYEQHGVSFQELRPLVWGPDAVTRYSLNPKAQKSLTLWNEFNDNRVLHLLKQKRVDATIARFPLHRGLQDESISEDIADEEVYDPAFMLPLLSQLLASEVRVQAWLVTRQALGIVLIALCSENNDIRTAAKTIIARLHFHLEASRMSADASKWVMFLNILRSTVQNTNDKPLPALYGVFLARATQIISNPENALFVKLNSFLVVRPVMDTDSVPELMRLLHSSEPEHRIHQQWILEVLRDGLRSQTDFSLFCSSFAFKLLGCLYVSSLSNLSVKVEILRIFSKVVVIPGCVWRLCSSNGLLSWLQGVISYLPSNAHDETSIQLYIEYFKLVSNIWNAATGIDVKDNKKNSSIQQVAPSLFNIIITALPKHPASLSVLHISLKVLCAICKTCPTMCKWLTQELLLFILNLCHRAKVPDIAECEDLFKFGCYFAPKSSRSNDELQNAVREIVILCKR